MPPTQKGLNLLQKNSEVFMDEKIGVRGFTSNVLHHRWDVQESRGTGEAGGTIPSSLD
jgi:hypothetical protein